VDFSTLPILGPKENAAATWKTFVRIRSPLVFADRAEIASGEALAGQLRAG
jgi:hypothetical protein